MNHKWTKENECSICGVKRKKRSWKKLMAVVNHPPWEAWIYGRDWFFSFNDFKDGTWKRPDCKNLNAPCRKA